MESDRQVVGPANSHLLHTAIEDDISFYDPRTERVTVLNRTASDIWRLADGTLTVSEITELLASSYQVDPRKISQDVADTVDRLKQEGILEYR